MRTWTKRTLQDLVASRMSGFRFIAVSNREPYIHTRSGGGVECMQPASGLATAIDPIMRASGGTWVAHGSGDADREIVDAYDRVRVPPEEPCYTLRRVWLPRQIEQEYYYGLANEGLWPLCHVAFHRPEFSERCWQSYRRANEIFAEAVLEEANGDPAFVFIQDYHFGLLPRMLKRSNPRLVIAQFWHIPWPNREVFRAFPWKDELLDGMLGNDLLGFHLRYHCSNFLETIDRNIESLVDTERGVVIRAGRTTTVRAFPISIDFEHQSKLAASPMIEAETAQWTLDLGTPKVLGIGIDRIDYTKGIPERLQAVDLLLEKHPEYVGRLVFVQVGVPSRTAIPGYQQLNARIEAHVQTINRRWQRGEWRPIVFVRRHVDQPALVALHRMADFCVVSSLHDGMNLVAKEFVGSRNDSDGVLVLSSFTGAARELTDALLVNPFSAAEITDAMHKAITMPEGERKRRMARMRSVVASNNIYRWGGKIIDAITGIDVPEPADSANESVAAAVGAE
jgi:trehalose 6-phosphate synthase